MMGINSGEPETSYCNYYYADTELTQILFL